MEICVVVWRVGMIMETELTTWFFLGGGGGEWGNKVECLYLF